MRPRAAVCSFFLAAGLIVLGLVRTSGQETAPAKIPLPALDPKLEADLSAYLRKSFQSPEDYILGKFKDHQIVFVGEFHRIRHDTLLIQRLIPLLYKAGVTDLGIEFGVNRDQDRVDKLITAPVYDEQEARNILFDWSTFWGFKEYEDLYRAAWEVNHGLPAGAPRFRVVNLNCVTDFSYVKTEADQRNREIMKKVWPEGDSDTFMAEVIFREFVNKGRKALVYSGIHHAFTRYKQPIYDQGKFVGFVQGRTGNRVRDRLGDKVCTIYLHAPWMNKTYDKQIYAAGGLIDAFFARHPDQRPAGFDLAGGPFGELSGPGSIYEEGYDPFSLKLFADGYIFTKPLSQYQGVTVDDKFITEANLKRAVEQVGNPEFRPRVTSVAVFVKAIEGDANIPNRFREFY